MPPKHDIHHVSFHFGKSKVLFSVPGSTTLAQLKLTLLSALPHLYPPVPLDNKSLPGLDPDELALMDLPTSPSPVETSTARNPDLPPRIIRYTREFCLWKARVDEDGELISYVSLEGDVDDFDPVENMPDPGPSPDEGVNSNGGEATESKGKGKARADAMNVYFPSHEGGGKETGDRATELKKRIGGLTNPAWERWVEVFVSFVEPDGTFNPPSIDRPPLLDPEPEQPGEGDDEQGNAGVGP